MLYLILILCILVLATILYFYRQEIRKINRQVQDIRQRPGNRLVTQEFYSRGLNQLVTNINRTIKTERDLRLQLEKKDQLQQELLTNLAHDIRTPLTSLDGYVQLLSEAETEAGRQRYLRVVRQRLKKLSSLLDQMFLYMRLEDAMYPIDLEKMDLKQESLSRLFAFYDAFQEKGQEPLLDLGEAEVWVWANGPILDHILTNLFKNALVHGDGDLRIQLQEDGSLKIANRYRGSLQGDPNELFHRFATGQTNRSQESHGLGLAIARSAIEKIGGKILAQVEGQTFTVHLAFKLAED